MSDNERTLFAKNLTDLMKKKHFSKAEMAKMLGVSSSTMSDWCNGNKYPRVDKMQRMADLLGVKMSVLVGGGEDRYEAYLSNEQAALLIAYDVAPEMMKDAVWRILRAARPGTDMSGGDLK